MSSKDLESQIKKIESLKALAFPALSKLARINGVGTTWDERAGGYALQVNLLDDVTKSLPTSFEGVPIVYRLIGQITPRAR
ncbi:hypothetical protein V8017_09790 [Stenotrophomonas rhizophila]